MCSAHFFAICFVVQDNIDKLVRWNVAVRTFHALVSLIKVCIKMMLEFVLYEHRLIGGEICL
jgi:hypothetical protein